MEERNQLVRQRGHIKAKLTVLSKYVEEWHSSIGLTALQLRINKAEEIWQEFQKIQSELSQLGEDSTLAIESEAFEKVYFLTLEKAYQFLDLDPIIQSPVIKNPPVQKQVSNLSLPKIRLITYSGDYTEWLNYSELFNSLVIQNPSLNNVQKLYYLKSSLEGTPASLVAPLSLTNENFEVAWDLLKRRYYNPNVIINQLVKNLFNLKKIERESKSALRELLDVTQRNIQSLKALEQPVEYWDVLLIYMISSKLDNKTQKAWQSEHSTATLPTFQQLLDFLYARCTMLDNLEIVHTAQPSFQKSKSYAKPKSSTQSRLTFVSRIENCSVCKENHPVYACPQFKQMSISDRVAHIKQTRVCYNCFRKHNVKECMASSCKHCQGRHNTLLHLPSSQSNSTSQTELTVSNLPSMISGVNVSQSTSSRNSQQLVLLATAILRIKNQNGTWCNARCLLDMASQANIISDKLCSELNLQQSHTNQFVLSINEKPTQVVSTVETFIASKSVRNFERKLKFLVLPKITGMIPAVPVVTSHFVIPDDIILADPQYGVPGEIDLLLGAEVFWDIFQPGTIELGKDCPSLRSTKLGWICTGKLPILHESNYSVCQLNLVNTLEKQISKFWETEEIDFISPSTSHTLECELLYKQSVQREPNGRYMVKLPRQQVPLTLGNSKHIALKQFYSLERKFSKHPVLAQQYQDFMQQYEDLGHMTRNNAELSQQENYFIPHFEVLRESSSSTPLRVVFNASQPTDNGVALNDILHSGHIVQDDLLSILLRFRTYNYVIAGDIKQFFRQILIHPTHRNLQQICWRKDRTQPIQIYQLNTVTYGMTCSPYLATRTLKQLYLDEGDKFPLAQNSFSSFYMDDFLDGRDDLHETALLRKQISQLLELGGFEICKWISNSSLLLSTIPADQISSKSILQFEKEQSTKMLGLEWQPKQDELLFSIKPPREIISKRAILSEIARIFDPLGLIGPVVTTAKIIMQELWLENFDWDQPLPYHIEIRWKRFRDNLNALSEISIPRCLKTRHIVNNFQIHVFSDASMLAYGTCAFLRTNYENAPTTVRLIASKSRVAPLKKVTLPRLELNAALLSTKLANKLIQVFRFQIQANFFWTDSTIVLAWLQKEPRQLQIYVANRVSQIQQHSHHSQWRHINSKENPADILSRGASPHMLSNSQLWWTGPTWLQQDTEQWPSDNRPVSENLPEIKSAVICMNIVRFSQEILGKYCSFSRLLHVVAYCFRFADNCRQQKSNRIIGPLLVTEIHKARDWIFKEVQRETFQQEIQALRKGQPVNKKSSIVSLNPFIDQDGIIRVGGRIQQSELPTEQKHSIILPNKHKVTRLLIMQEHLKNLHAGPQLLLSILRQSVWILQGRVTIRSVLSKCVTCFRVRPRMACQQMGQLPKARVTPNQPFTVTGIDYCGPFLAKESKRKNAKVNKVYLAIFVCFSTKATHIELVRDLTTEAFLAALRRFISRRGRCKKIYSDNATNFVGASRQLREMADLFLSQQHQNAVHLAALEEGIEWHWIPPTAPHQGGLWESCVKQCKYHLRRVMGQSILTYDALHTLVTQIECCLNSRPLIPLSEDHNDLEVLTPGHFLIGKSMKVLPEPNLSHIIENRLDEWQRVQQMFQKFWKLWSSDYIHNLQPRHKWREIRANLKPGTLVLISQQNLPPLMWKLGRITQVHTGPDGQVRVVTIKTTKGEITRAVQQIAPLPL